jgi:hypothetical protein
MPYLAGILLVMLVQHGLLQTAAAVRRLSLPMLVAAMCLALQSIAIVWACLLTTVANVFFILQLAPLLSAIVQYFFLGELVPLRTCFLILAGIASVAIILVGNLLPWRRVRWRRSGSAHSGELEHILDDHAEESKGKKKRRGGGGGGGGWPGHTACGHAAYGWPGHGGPRRGG